MGTILASKIIDDCERIIQDTTNAKAGWTAANHLINLNLVQRAAAILKPDISVSNAVTGSALAAGTKQTLASVSADGTGFQFIKLTRNYGTDGTTPGNPISYIDMQVMNECVPTWHTDTASATVQHYLFDPQDPKTFFVYPPQPTSNRGYVELVEYTIPADIASADAAITLEDIYETVLLDGLLYYTLTIDTPHSLYQREVAIDFWNRFVEGLGRKDLNQQMDNPKTLPKMPGT